MNLFIHSPRRKLLKKMSVDEDKSRFDLLKAHFGSENDADKLTFEEFAALSNKRVEMLVDRILNIKIAGEISAIRKRAIEASQASQQSGRRRLKSVRCALPLTLSNFHDYILLTPQCSYV